MEKAAIIGVGQTPFSARRVEATFADLVFEAATAARIGRELPTEWFLQDIRD